MGDNMKVGLFGGSFDPLHFGHLNLAIELKEKWGLEEVWFCPAKISPLKMHLAPKVDAQQRLEMLRLVLSGIPGFRVLDIEVNREGPSYTVDTLLNLHKQYPGNEYYLLMGDDVLTKFFKWHKPDEIVSLAALLIGLRSKGEHLEILGDAEIRKALKEGMTETRVMEISSTELRERLKKRAYCGHLVPAKILDYIYQNDLYL